ncbi:alpha-ketoglutarate-dependent dioxygenase AlkB [Pseudokineococcus basanitobsidens]|uniref:Alpha-ketoglutarate-dependent dioxygenase AlkB n=1 Tax=Pseudokineococcus basanitobsidens TaxID=1926649 RepID=A0ABU8RHU3_9ACTN
MSLTTQPSLLDDVDDRGTSWLAPLAEGLERHELSRGAWVDVRPDWVRHSQALFEHLLADVPWRAERRQMYEREVDVPRLLCFYGEGAVLPHPLLGQARDALSAHYLPELGEPLVTAGLCLYRDGRDGVAWHGDRIGRSSREDTVVAIVSLGAPRPLVLRPRGGGRTELRLPVGHGDLFVMGGSCQRTWEHAVPKTSRPVGPRVSVQLRPRGVR